MTWNVVHIPGRDVIKGKRDVIKGKRDVIKGKRDVGRDVIKGKRERLPFFLHPVNHNVNYPALPCPPLHD
jgi:hypothetical protein